MTPDPEPDRADPSRARSGSRLGALGVVLFILGLVSIGVFRLLAGAEHHSFAPSPVAPNTVHLTTGRTYQLAVVGGVAALTKAGADPSTAQCSYTEVGQLRPQALVVTTNPDTKATNTVATFQSRVTGSVHIDCVGWGPVFVDDADDAAPDRSGWFLLLGVAALTVGFALALSALRTAAARGRIPEQDEEIDRLVHLVHESSVDDDPADIDPPRP